MYLRTFYGLVLGLLMVLTTSCTPSAFEAPPSVQPPSVQATPAATETTLSSLLKPRRDYTSQASGCGDIFVYKSNDSQSEYIVAWISAGAFDISTEPITLDVSENPETIIVRIDVYSDVVTQLGEFPYCNDVVPMAEPQSVWQALAGKVTVRVSEELPSQPCTGQSYEATIQLRDVIFAHEGEMVQMATMTFDDVPVGWCAG